MSLTDEQIRVLLGLTEEDAKLLLGRGYTKSDPNWKMYKRLQEALCYLVTDCGVTLNIEQLRFLFYSNKLTYLFQ